ncbi:monocarboxylate transporter 3 [Heterocephalus glaber]|uniref:Monocarboxylate transporter 3 n=1 Tax=Heterocephalus glaber TaxID=10181 RepID=A0AAX6P882_HETGA|nr:monocarboxylate transporter 3 [Heterocephalus glaber]
MRADGPRRGMGPGVGPPDGGWGWVVLAACFVVTGFAYGFPKAVSVFFRSLMRDFGAGYSDTAWVSSIMLAMLYGTGPVSSILVTRFGCRPVMLAGGLLAAAGMILASFARRLLELYLTAGVLTGLGLALNFQPSLIMLGLYFERRRPLANGLAAAGSPVFLCALSPLGQVLLERFGWRGGFLLFGGLLLHCCACGAVMRPSPPGPGPRPRADCAEDTSGDAPGAVEADGARRNLHETPPSGRARRRLLEVAVCTDRAFIVYVVTKFLMALGLFVPAILLVNYAKDAGVPDADAAFLLSIVGFVDIVARPACGALAGLPRLRPHVPYLFSLALLANGLTDLGSARARSYGALVAFCVVFGLSYGTVGALQFEVLMAAVGAPRFPSALGLVLLVEAVAVLIGPPSAGHLVDALKNYEIIFYLAGSEVALAGVFMAMATCCLRHQSHSLEASAGAATGGAASDTEDSEERGSLQALEMLTPKAGAGELKVDVESGPGQESV